MFSSESSFELYNSRITDVGKEDGSIVLECNYMQYDRIRIVFQNVSQVENDSHLKGNTISFLKTTKAGYEIHFINEEIAPTVICASAYRIDWQ